jgi:AraC-like DNA-binding protein
MANMVGMSRMHLNRKIKAMTGMTPNELIRVVRLNRAAELLLTGVSVSETADRVGFDTAAYFSKVFKEQYHVTPSEFVEKSRHEIAG